MVLCPEKILLDIPVSPVYSCGMLKHLLILTTALTAFTSLAPLYAQDEEAPVKKEKAAKRAISPVVTAVKKVKKVRGKLNDKADYYIYLYSASWCGPCCREMPEIVELHKEVQKTGKVDFILFSQDRTPKAAAGFVKRFKIKFLTVMGDDKDASKVPGMVSPNGIPHCAIVDRYGRKITHGHPAIVLPEWKSLTIDKGEPEPPVK